MKKKKEKEKQLDFGLKNTPKNIYYKYKDQYELWLAGLETKKFIKDPFTWFTLVISFSLITTQMLTIEGEENIPSKIPILNYYINPSLRLVHNEYVYLFPLLAISLVVISIYFSSKNYHRERSLSKLILLAMLLSNLSLCLILLKLFLIF